jgi:hypothetical protein
MPPKSMLRRWPSSRAGRGGLSRKASAQVNAGRGVSEPVGRYGPADWCQPRATTADSPQKHGTLARLRRSLGIVGLGPRPKPSRFGCNLPEDTAYAHKLPAFNRVLHVFHKQ